MSFAFGAQTTANNVLFGIHRQATIASRPRPSSSSPRIRRLISRTSKREWMFGCLSERFRSMSRDGRSLPGRFQASFMFARRRQDRQ